MDIITGFESTNIGSSNRDVFETTQHDKKYEEDFDLLQEAGISLIRYPLRWHKIERERRGRYDWSATDRQLLALRDRNIRVIADPLHHTSISPLIRGFLDPSFVDAYTQFCLQAIERYHWIDDWTPINEPYATAMLAGRIGVWHPHGRTRRTFAAILANFAKAFVIISAEVVRQGKRVVHFDACEHHTGDTRDTRTFAHDRNERRFLFPELVLGRLEATGFNAQWLRTHLGAGDLEWFRDRAGFITEVGLDYYAHCEIAWRNDTREIVRAPHVRSPIGFAEIARQYRERLGLPVWLGETNVRGFTTDRLTWLKYMLNQCEQAGINRFCWFPFIDSTDWDSLVTRAESHIDPQGIYWLKPPEFTRQPSELSEAFSQLSKGKIAPTDLPLHPFEPPLDGQLTSFLSLIK